MAQSLSPGKLSFLGKGRSPSSGLWPPSPLREKEWGAHAPSRVDSGAPPESFPAWPKERFGDEALGGALKAARGGACAPRCTGGLLSSGACRYNPPMRFLPALFASALAVAALPLGQAARPNVILVMTDDQGYPELSAHGNPVLNTPFLDKLHSQSVRFTDYHASPMCTPTRGSLMT